MPWKIFEVEVSGYGAGRFTAPSRGKALSRAWGSPAFEGMAFRDFLKIAKIRRVELPASGHYGYVSEQYGLDVAIGDRVKTPFGDGEVLYPEGPTASVHILLDGRRCCIHPNDVHLVK